MSGRLQRVGRRARVGRAQIGRVSPPAPAKTESGSPATTSLNFRSFLTTSLQYGCSARRPPKFEQKPSDSIGPVVVTGLPI
jgi:hypothetical protein